MASRIASLPMYDLPEARWATDAWWAGLARAFRAAGVADVPDHLTRSAPYHGTWTDPNLLFTQTCGYPLTHGFARHLRPLAAIRLAIDGCDGIDYHSLVLVRAASDVRGLADLRGAVCAYNNFDSQSGMNTLRHAVATFARDGRFFARTIETGGHRASMIAVKAGTADVCSVDVATYNLLVRHAPSVPQGLRILARTAAAPGLPYTTRIEADADKVRRLRAGLAAAAADPDLAAARAALFIAGVEVVERADYERVDTMEREARDLGYPELA
ncbi:MAG: phosphate/phosphite/phosphonate ABC transporter substrate-binding protein [Alphaproteobacteria bacterium]